MKQSRLLYIIIIALVTFSCNSERNDKDYELITSQKDQENFLIGKWGLDGILKSENGISGTVDGEIEFQKSKQFNVIFGVTIKKSSNSKPKFIIACKGNGVWKWLENGMTGIDRDSPSSCECTIDPLNNKIGDRDLEKLKEELAICNGKGFAFGYKGKKGNKSSFNTGNIEFRKNNIDFIWKNLAKGRSIKISMERNNPLK